MKLLITGATGYLGARLCQRADVNHEVVAVHHAHPVPGWAGPTVGVDLTDEAAVRRVVQECAPDAVIHTAAVNPGGPEDRMMAVNGDGAGHVARAASEVGARLVSVSSDVVHDGTAAPYDEAAVPTPLSLYGRSKAVGEAAVLFEDPTAAVVRTSLIYGLHAMDRGTAGFVARLDRGEPVLLFRDVLRQPVWVEALIDALLELVDPALAGAYCGVLDVVGAQVLTREQFGRRMLAWWGVDAAGCVHGCNAADVSDAIPLDLRVRLDRAAEVLSCGTPGVDEVLSRHPSPPRARG